MIRRWAGALALALALAALAVGGACLPDLAAIAADEAPAESGASFRGCGDGIIASLPDGGDAGESCDPGPDAATGCSGCQIACEGVIDPKSGHCYFKGGDESSYESARARCNAVRAHVVTFAGDDEVAFVRKNVAADETGYWIGLLAIPALDVYDSERPEEPAFPFTPRASPAKKGPCDGCFGFGADAGVFPIADMDASNLFCVASRVDGWSQVPCTAPAPRPTVCEREPVGVRALDDCIIGAFCFGVPKTSGEKTYVVLVSSADPDQAAETCAGLDGGSLVIFGTREEREQVAHEVLGRYVEKELWIGLAADAGSWSWGDGVKDLGGGRPAPWGNAQPEGGAGARAFMRIALNSETRYDYDTQLAYADDGGRTPRAFICQRPAK